MKSDHKIHKYELVELGSKGYKVYKCKLPNCRHFIQKELAVGRLSLCNGVCNSEVIITRDMVTRELKVPLCDDCREKRKNRRALVSAIKGGLHDNSN